MTSLADLTLRVMFIERAWMWWLLNSSPVCVSHRELMSGCLFVTWGSGGFLGGSGWKVFLLGDKLQRSRCKTFSFSVHRRTPKSVLCQEEWPMTRAGGARAGVGMARLLFARSHSFPWIRLILRKKLIRSCVVSLCCSGISTSSSLCKTLFLPPHTSTSAASLLSPASVSAGPALGTHAHTHIQHMELNSLPSVYRTKSLFHSVLLPLWKPVQNVKKKLFSVGISLFLVVWCCSVVESRF